MYWLAFIAALAITLVSDTALAFEATFKLPCMIVYAGKLPISTLCIASISMSNGMTIEKVKTPNDRTFIIENDKPGMGAWYLDHERAVKVSDEPNTCYQNQQVKICL